MCIYYRNNWILIARLAHNHWICVFSTEGSWVCFVFLVHSFALIGIYSNFEGSAILFLPFLVFTDIFFCFRSRSVSFESRRWNCFSKFFLRQENITHYIPSNNLNRDTKSMNPIHKFRTPTVSNVEKKSIKLISSMYSNRHDKPIRQAIQSTIMAFFDTLDSDANALQVHELIFSPANCFQNKY